ncbi:MAG TPA: amino acid adenylation domain-containing protein, partial [Acidimicrobiales bacterium]|nr:amino acid adenylation domain-containing protein [Acidimicrobiales bacterium]
MSLGTFERDGERVLSDGLSLLVGAQAAPARTLQDVFASTVATFPDRVALDDGVSQLSYQELDAAARQLAARLFLRGIGRGDRVGVRVTDGTSELYQAILGVLFSGAAYVPVDVADPEARAREVWREAGVAAVVADGLEIITMRPGRGASGPARPGDDCWVIFTSGSTGTPKGVAVTHRSAAAFVDAEATLWEVRPEDRVLAALSVGFDASCEEMWLAWRHGAALVPAPRRLVTAGGELGRWLVARDITVISTVPTLAAMWDERDLEQVRLLVLGGEACPDQLIALATATRELWNTYGPTEATVVSTAARIRPGERVTIGRPLPGWNAAVIGEGGELLPLGEPGELVLGGVGLGRYLDAGLDGRKFAPMPALGWTRAYRTGDIVRASAECLEYLGRRDGQVKVGGRRIELGELEARLSSLPGVRQAAAALRRTASGEAVLVAYYVGEAAVAELREELVAQLPPSCVPLVVALGSFPLNQAGKLDRNALPWPPPDDDPLDELTPTESLLA